MRGRRRDARLPRIRGADHVLHLLAGPDADDSGAVPPERRAAAGRPARQLPHGRDARVLHLRRPFRRDGVPPDGPGDDLRRQRTGGHGPDGRPAPRRHRGARAVPAFLRRVPHLARNSEGGGHGLRGPAPADQPEGPGRVPRQGAEPGPPRAAQHGAEPGHLLPGARSGEPVLRRPARNRGKVHAGDRQNHRQKLPPFRLLRRPGRRVRDCGHGLRQRHGERGRGFPRQARGEGRLPAGPAVPPVFGEAFSRGHA